jgi:hemolysin III
MKMVRYVIINTPRLSCETTMKNADDENKFTREEEIVNAISHGIGTLLSIAALLSLIIVASTTGTIRHVVGFTGFGLALILLYSFSTLQHGLHAEKAKHIFEILDHSAIYVLIAATYTVFTLTILTSPLGWSLFGIEWGLAIGGILFKCLFLGKFERLSTMVYLIMGWLIIIAIFPLKQSLPPKSFILLVIGGIFYTIGVYFYSKATFKFHHAIWHILVLAGSISHFFSVLYILI